MDKVISKYCKMGVWLLSMAVAMLSRPVCANPSGGTVASGGATFNNSGNTLTVTTATQQTIINWQNFSIGSGELTKILQPNASSTTLNRVVSGNPSAIYGTLQSNGNVILVNPNGVVVGAGGVINTQSFLATTHPISDASFLAGGDLRLQGNSNAAVINLGSINAEGGDVILVARNVSNSGAIQAKNGTVALAAGTDVTLYAAGEQHVSVNYTTGTKSGTGVENSGTINALRAELKANGNLYSLAINNTGLVNATSVNKVGGQVWLVGTGGTVKNSGKIVAKNETKGGQVTVTGDDVHLTSTSAIDAQGANGGGTVKVGGGAQGKDSTVANAKTLKVDAGSIIAVDALDNGNGGTAILWSDSGTEYYGTITAQGGVNGGNGGFVEVSGGNLAYRGAVNLFAPKGKNGTLLLDPGDITIYTTAPSTAGINYVLVSDITSALATGNVVIQTTNSTTGTGSGDINVNDNIALTGANGGNNDLTLTAYRNVVINSGVTISNTGSGSLYVLADNSATGTGVVTQSGTVNYSGGGNVNFYYNPTTFGTPTTYSGVTVTGGGSFTPYMYINSLANYQTLYGTSSLWDKNFALAKDLNVSSLTPTPIGNGTTAFTGKFDGLNHTITGLTIDESGTNAYAGFFGRTNGASIENLTLSGTTVYNTYSAGSASYTGALIGAAYITKIKNVTISGTTTVSADASSGGSNATSVTTGGVVGYLSGASSLISVTLEDGATIGAHAGGSGTTNGGSAIAGGLVGYDASNSTIQYSSTAGFSSSVSATGGNTTEASSQGGDAMAGGLVGRAVGTSTYDSNTDNVWSVSATAGQGLSSFVNGTAYQNSPIGQITGSPDTTHMNDGNTAPTVSSTTLALKVSTTPSTTTTTTDSSLYEKILKVLLADYANYYKPKVTTAATVASSVASIITGSISGGLTATSGGLSSSTSTTSSQGSSPLVTTSSSKKSVAAKTVVATLTLPTGWTTQDGLPPTKKTITKNSDLNVIPPTTLSEIWQKTLETMGYKVSVSDFSTLLKQTQASQGAFTDSEVLSVQTIIMNAGKPAATASTTPTPTPTPSAQIEPPAPSTPSAPIEHISPSAINSPSSPVVVPIHVAKRIEDLLDRSASAKDATTLA